MKFQVVIKQSAEKQLEKIPKADYYRILSALSTLFNNPYMGKKMLGEYKDYYYYKVWPYRIIYKIVKQETFVLIIQISHS